MSEEIYVSTDVETDGPVPGPHSMLSLASAAYRGERLLATFTANLELLPGAEGHPRTMAWWETQPEAWAASRTDPRPPRDALTDYAAWLDGLPGTPVFVAYPLAFDWMFVAWYLERFAGRNPFGFCGLDVKSFAMAMLGFDFHGTVKGNLPERWFDDLPHTHVALDDALAQGALFCNMLAENRGRHAASSS